MNTFSLRLFLVLFLLGSSFQSFGQCGIFPTSGTTFITTTTTPQLVNSYYPGTGNPVLGATSITVGALDSRGSGTVLAPGDLILIIQMQGADINATNTDAYGNGISGGTASGYITSNLMAGYYEYNVVGAISGSSITLAYPLANAYFTRNFTTTTGIRRYQVIRLPRYFNLSIASGVSITAPAWNGSTGGVVALEAQNTITNNGSINVSAKGFRGGGGKHFTGATTGNTNGSGALLNTDFRFNSAATTTANLTGGAKGEGIAGTPRYIRNEAATTTTQNGVEGYINGSMGRGAPGNAGGGGTDGAPVGSVQNQYNTGGGGGSNGGVGGQGGSGWHGDIAPTNATKYPFGGHGGSPFAQTSLKRFIMGGGGGAGTGNNGDTNNEFRYSGGAGGGIIIMRAASYSGNGSVLANGGDAPGLSTATAGQTDAGGGGGGGGTIVIVTKTDNAAGISGYTVSAAGGKGGDAVNHFDHGPGGGGGGGIIYHNGTFATQPNVAVAAGLNGRTRSGSPTGTLNNDYGATPGTIGRVFPLTVSPILTNSNSVSSPCGPLPVEMVSFSAKKLKNGTFLEWKTATEKDNDYFLVERSVNGKDFYQIGKVKGNGTSNTINLYNFLDVQPLSGFNYYRLKQLDFDGTFEYSKIVVVDNEAGNRNAMARVFPNPVAGNGSLTLTSNFAEDVTITICDAIGNTLSKERLKLQEGQNNIPLQVQHFVSGVYIVQISGAKTNTVLKFQKL